MTTRLPIPGGDANDWGIILNEFLEMSHNSDGSLKAGAITDAGGAVIDVSAGDIAPLGTQAAGSTGKAADAGHVHAMPRLDQVLAPTAAVAMNAQKLTGLANGTAATDAAAYGQLPTYPSGATATSVARPMWLNAKDYGAAGNGSTDDTAALSAAFAAGNTQLLPVFIPPGTYKITSMIDLSSQHFTAILGASVQTNVAGFNGAGIYAGATTIVQTTSNTSAVRFGGFCDISGITIKAPGGSTNACMELANVSEGSRLYNLRLQGGAYSINLPQQSFGGNGNWGAFSTSFSDLRLSAPTIGFINWSAYNNSTTGNVWKNIYCNADGSPSPSATKIYFSNCNECEFIQVNIEGCEFNTYGGLITLNQCGAFTFDGIHFERITGGASGWQAFLYVYDAAILHVRNLTIEYCTMNAAGATYYAVRGENEPFNITIDGLQTGGSSNTIGSWCFWLAGFGSNPVAAGNCSIEIKNIADSGGSEFGTNVHPTDQTTLNTRQPIMRVGSQVFAGWIGNSNYQCYTSGAAPTSGTWIAGDEVRVQVPAVAGTSGSQYTVAAYVCTVSGTPGTWVGQRMLTGT